ncbi:hypothetical protein JB92DRAFT_2960193, partial [Gautieria morchelliformis]
MELSASWGPRGSALAIQVASRYKNLVRPPILPSLIFHLLSITPQVFKTFVSTPECMDSDGLNVMGSLYVCLTVHNISPFVFIFT